MARNVSNRSESPVRGRRSPSRRSPSRRERSPARQKSLRRESSPPREKSPSRHKSSYRGSSPDKEKHSTHAKTTKRAGSDSPISRSPSPRTKRLRRSQGDKDVEKVKDREHERNGGRVSEKGARKERSSERERERERERDSEREIGNERRERRSGRDDGNGRSTRGRHDRSTSPSGRHHRSRHRSRSPVPTDSRAHDEETISRGGSQRNEDDEDAVARMKATEEALKAKAKQEPDFAYSGKLAEETNRVRGVALLFTQPPEARKPDKRWRLYVFKDGKVLEEPLYIHRESCYLFGRERRVADIPTDHPSCSKQHAVIQFRQIEKEKPDGMLSKQILPYLMDLGSTNKTYLNETPIEPQRYYELLEKDTIKFGNSSREYVLLHENSAEAS